MNVSSIGVQTILPAATTAQQQLPQPSMQQETAPKPESAAVPPGVGEHVDQSV